MMQEQTSVQEASGVVSKMMYGSSTQTHNPIIIPVSQAYTSVMSRQRGESIYVGKE